MLLEKDAINNLHREYFEVMDISEEAKLERIELAELLDDVFLFLFMYAESFDDLDVEAYRDMAMRRYTDALEEYGISFDKYPDIEEYAVRMMNNIVDSTIRQKNERGNRNTDISNGSRNISNNSNDNTGDNGQTDKALSSQEKIQERAINVAQNEANSIFNRMEYDDAVYSGFTKKTWVTEGDSKVRHTHVEVDMETIPIDQPFYVGGSQMMFCRDDSLGATADEIANCRCTTVYS